MSRLKTDSLFYRLFSTAPHLLFELLGDSPAVPYQFQSVEVKQTAFRLDGIFLPPAADPDLPIYFVEVQFQLDPDLYRRLFAEIFLFLAQNPRIRHWKAVVILARRSIEPKQKLAYVSLLESDQVERIYLNQLPPDSGLPGINLVRLVVASRRQAAKQARKLLTQVEQGEPWLPQGVLLELIETIMVYKFSESSREEIAKMLGLAESITQTRVYQEGKLEGRAEGKLEGKLEGRAEGKLEGKLEGRAEGKLEGKLEGRAEGKLEGERSLIVRLLTRRMGTLSPGVLTQLQGLSLEQVEALGEALLDFATPADLDNWLKSL
ncbi:hypothetical protein DO97_20960 [Neosynechococcus sphagnicola sy1]|uniref:DUF4351 domain-containing protein n=1 Tax=Neosynechococcus sphagnicola sy1 TaxID=1497020 RepID=A0A098TLW2_9CYAN|nr:hypothetical protein DO97_20960 [Neosynechococcus sphagnicola sy1]